MSQIISSPSNDSAQQEYDPRDILAPDSLSDGKEDSEDVIPPTQDVYDNSFVLGSSKLHSRKDLSISPSDKPSALSAFGGRSLFGASAPSMQSPIVKQRQANQIVGTRSNGVDLSGEKEEELLQQEHPQPETLHSQEPAQQDVSSKNPVVLSGNAENSGRNSLDFLQEYGEKYEEDDEEEAEDQSRLLDNLKETETSVSPSMETDSAQEENLSLRMSQGSATQKESDQAPGSQLLSDSATTEDPGALAETAEGHDNEENLESDKEQQEKAIDEEGQDQEIQDESGDHDAAEVETGLMMAGVGKQQENDGEDEDTTDSSGKGRRQKRLSRRQRMLLTWEKRRQEAGKEADEHSSSTPQTNTRNEDKETPRKRRGRKPAATTASAESSSEKRSLRARGSIETPKPADTPKEPAKKGRKSTRTPSESARKQAAAEDPSSDESQPAQRLTRERKIVWPQRRPAKAETPPARPKRQQRAQRVPATEQVHSTPKVRVQRGEELRKTQSERKPGPGRRRGKMAAPSAASLDPYDIDGDDFDSSPAPLKHINVARSFGDIRFSKAPSTQSSTSKYARLEKSAELRRQTTPLSSARVSSDTQPLRKTTVKNVHTITPKQRRLMSPTKSTPSSGNLGDVSSLGTKSSSGSGAYPRSSLGSSSGSRGKFKSSSSGGNGSVSLFSEIEPMSSENVGEEEEETNTSTVVDWREEVDAETPGKGKRRRKRRTPQEMLDAQPERKRKRPGQDESDLIPQKQKPTYSQPELTPEQQLDVDHPASEGPSLLPGGRVLAAWKDKNYYPGHIVESEGFGRYKVIFLDGSIRDMPRPDIVPLAQLKIGDILMLDNVEAGELHPIVIESVPDKIVKDWYEGIFKVNNKAKEEHETIHWKKLVIDPSQKKPFVSSSVNVAAEQVTADNISGGRARRTRPTSFSPVTPSPRRKPGAAPGRKKARQESPAVKEQRLTAENAAAKAAEEKDEIQQLFEGMKFVLTSANRKVKESGSADDEKPSVQFVKKDVRRMIEERGGTVIDDFSQVTDPNNVFLVADTHYRTHKYLSALARAIPCVCHIWIHDCCKTNEFREFKNYMLPAGVSLEREQLIDWHDECPSILKDKTVMVHTENRPPPNKASLDFVQIWAPLVRCMGADVVSELPSEEERLDMLLTDASCSEDFLDEANSLGAFAVSSEWLIQAIITGGRPDPESHQKYKYDYIEPTAVQSSGDSSGPR